MKKYRIHFEQDFDGTILKGSYIRTVEDERELAEIEKRLYEDPHVLSVYAEELEE